MTQERFYGGAPLSGLFFKFGAGVDFFFVLSGFIIASAHWNDIGCPDRVGHYALKRFLRIYPAYWVILLPLSLAYFSFPSAGVLSQHDPLNFVFSFFLLPYPSPPILGVAWTLVYEMLFYTVFALLIVIGRPAFVLFAVWGVSILIFNTIFWNFSFPLSVVTDVHNIEFLIGIASAKAVQKFKIPAPRFLATAGFVCFAAQMLVTHSLLEDPLVGRIGYGAAAAVGIIGIVEWERSHYLRVPGWLREMGAASYAIYLVHGLAISIAVQIITRVFPSSFPPSASFLMLIIAGLMGGFVYHHLVENPWHDGLADGDETKAGPPP